MCQLASELSWKWENLINSNYGGIQAVKLENMCFIVRNVLINARWLGSGAITCSKLQQIAIRPHGCLWRAVHTLLSVSHTSVQNLGKVCKKCKMGVLKIFYN